MPRRAADIALKRFINNNERRSNQRSIDFTQHETAMERVHSCLHQIALKRVHPVHDEDTRLVAMIRRLEFLGYNQNLLVVFSLHVQKHREQFQTTNVHAEKKKRNMNKSNYHC